MRVVLKVTVCMLTCVLGFGLSYASGQTANPESKEPSVKVIQEFAAIEVPETNFDFGKILEGAEVSHDFIVRNTGKSPLQIKKVQANCECIKTEYDQVVQPGAQGKISIKIDSRGRGGSFFKFILVSSNDPIQPQLRLQLKGLIQPLISMQPGNLISFEGVSGTVQAKAIDLKATSVKLFHIARTETNIPNKITYEVEPISDGKHYRLKVMNKTEAGIYNGFIKLFTDLPDNPEVIVEVKGKIRDVISVLPPKVLLGKIPSEDRIRFAEVQVRTNLDKPFKITKLSYDEQLISVEQKALPDNVGYSLLLSPKLENIKVQDRLTEGARQHTVVSIQTDARPDKTYQVNVQLINLK